MCFKGSTEKRANKLTKDKPTKHTSTKDKSKKEKSRKDKPAKPDKPQEGGREVSLDWLWEADRYEPPKPAKGATKDWMKDAGDMV